jgi:putative MATE family efflux protein
MKDLTQGPIPKHVIEMAIPMAVGMFVQTLYYLVDLYFVGRLGDVALAGVSAAGNSMFLIIALTQILGVGTVALIAHATGRKDRDDANLVFNQSLLLAAVLGVMTLVCGYAWAGDYLRAIAADRDTVQSGLDYLHWFLPGMALQFALVAMGSALRGTGIVKPTMLVQMLTVVLNIILAPVLIAGWGTGHPLGVAGAGLASSLSVGAGVILLYFYFNRLEKFVAVDRALWRPQLPVWKRMLGIGLPAGGEFMLMFVFMAVIYWAIRDFGAAAQAGFGLGSRIMQAIFLPAMALAFSAPAVAGQNFGARLPDRVRETFRWTALMSSAVMLALTLLCQFESSLLVTGFSTDPEVIEVAATFLRFISWNFIPSALIFTCSGLFQAIGNTWPAMLSTATRVLTFVVPVAWVSQTPSFVIEDVWYLSVAAVALQAVISYLLLQREFRRRLIFPPEVSATGL